MRDIDALKRKNLLEKVGFFIKEKPKDSLMIAISLMLVISLIIASPYFVFLSQKHTAQKLINEATEKVETLNKVHREAYNILNSNSNIYKDFDLYQLKLQAIGTKCQEFFQQVERYKRDFEKNDIKKILTELSHYKDKEKKRRLFQDEITEIKTKADAICNDIKEIYDTDTELKKFYKQFSSFENNITDILQDKENKLNQIFENGKTQRVKDYSNNLYDILEEDIDNFSDDFAKLEVYDASSEGKYDLTELRSLKQRYSTTLSLYNKVNNAIKDFDNYWNELHEQYYKIVTKHYYERRDDYVIEPNPLYREWMEEETYTDYETRYRTETRTERVYVGSRIVGDTQEDIYQTQTVTVEVPYTVPVQKTRTVIKNNGQPRTVPVCYDEYHFFYTVETHTPTGVKTENIEVGKKHEKYDIAYRAWNYSEDQQIGYTVWKQLWNDNKDIKRGMNLKPVFE